MLNITCTFTDHGTCSDKFAIAYASFMMLLCCFIVKFVLFTEAVFLYLFFYSFPLLHINSSTSHTYTRNFPIFDRYK